LWRRPRPKVGCGAKERRKKMTAATKGENTVAHFSVSINQMKITQ
jgi:hypothetical protein